MNARFARWCQDGARRLQVLTPHRPPPVMWGHRVVGRPRPTRAPSFSPFTATTITCSFEALGCSNLGHGTQPLDLNSAAVQPEMSVGQGQAHEAHFGPSSELINISQFLHAVQHDATPDGPSLFSQSPKDITGSAWEEWVGLSEDDRRVIQDECRFVRVPALSWTRENDTSPCSIASIFCASRTMFYAAFFDP